MALSANATAVQNSSIFITALGVILEKGQYLSGTDQQILPYSRGLLQLPFVQGVLELRY